MNKNTEKKAFNMKTALVVGVTTLATSLMASVDTGSILFSTNVLEIKEHAPFDGTVYPMKKVPNWTKLSSDKRDQAYSALSESDLMDIPYYDPKQLEVSADTLKWGNPVDDMIRNAKITYSVPYMGNYKLDGHENGGSHPAVDIKIPEETPIFSIANGTVIKASTQSSGFGHHIVIQHNNFPSLSDANSKSTIYSSYSHLGDVLISEGEVVSKGQQIALSGSTGTATTPHLHFQIDNNTAPWHPYWPFTWQEAQEAGLDFFSAINEGLGKEKAIETTINPMNYVQAYMNGSAPVVDSSDNVAETIVVVPEGEDATSYVPENPVVAEETVATTETEVTPVETETVPEVVPEVIEEGTPEEVVKAQFSDVPEDSKYYEAITYLVSEGIIEGYDDDTFKPDQAVNRVESLKFILEGISAAVEKGQLPFTDVSSEAWYSGYLYTAYKREIVNGHPDGTFKPEDAVNKAEFFKILFNGLSVDINPDVASAPYDDVVTTDWFAPYMAYAKELKILDPEAKIIEPSRGMTRGEVAEAIYKLMKLVK